LTYECRVATTDATAHRRFARYWMLVRPFFAHIMHATVRAVERDAYRRDLDARRRLVSR
jgi:hypothetical protein